MTGVNIQFMSKNAIIHENVDNMTSFKLADFGHSPTVYIQCITVFVCFSYMSYKPNKSMMFIFRLCIIMTLSLVVDAQQMAQWNGNLSQ